MSSITVCRRRDGYWVTTHSVLGTMLARTRGQLTKWAAHRLLGQQQERRARALAVPCLLAAGHLTQPSLTPSPGLVTVSRPASPCHSCQPSRGILGATCKHCLSRFYNTGRRCLTKCLLLHFIIIWHSPTGGLFSIICGQHHWSVFSEYWTTLSNMAYMSDWVQDRIVLCSDYCALHSYGWME